MCSTLRTIEKRIVNEYEFSVKNETNPNNTRVYLRLSNRGRDGQRRTTRVTQLTKTNRRRPKTKKPGRSKKPSVRVRAKPRARLSEFDNPFKNNYVSFIFADFGRAPRRVRAKRVAGRTVFGAGNLLRFAGPGRRKG